MQTRGGVGGAPLCRSVGRALCTLARPIYLSSDCVGPCECPVDA